MKWIIVLLDNNIPHRAVKMTSDSNLTVLCRSEAKTFADGNISIVRESLVEISSMYRLYDIR